MIARRKRIYGLTSDKGKAGPLKGEKERGARTFWLKSHLTYHTAHTHVRTHGTTPNDFPVTGGACRTNPPRPIIIIIINRRNHSIAIAIVFLLPIGPW